MVREIIPSKSLIIGLPVADNILKYCAEHGVKKGFTPIAPITIMVDDKTISWEDVKKMITAKDMKITLIQFES